ncbi:MAG: hypothetical protein KME10_05930 [Plectolyngbya sp. WJT66-NPBG17]|jgi:hypothetical protein|nr:hypothetical protein [Plectolyngbya sp. WJT66-NPBG17]MBW4526954.1 hypothetical protein [Phormidium tanganyikae FI6-MK23]
MKLQLPKMGAIPWRSIGSFVAIASAAGFVVSSTWLSAQFIIDPRSVVWMNQYLPKHAKIPISAWDDPKTLREIQADLRRAGLFAGEPIRVETAIKGKQKQIDLLIPVYRPPGDGSDDRLTELRAYRLVFNPTPNKKEALQFVNQIEVRELREDFVTEPLVRARAINPSSDRPVPFTAIQRFEDRAPRNGAWLTLNGKLKQGDNSIAYGQVVYYNPTTTAMSVMLSWTSPDGEIPSWQAVPKGRPAEFVVNQTVGLEPDFQVYQLRSVKRKNIPFQLQPISLSQSGLKEENGAFVDALFLARSGLWSNALEYMQSIKRQVGSDWTINAQSQMDLVARHAKVTKAQAEQPWANAGQQVLANLLDGRWERAAQFVQNPSSDRSEILDVLKFDPGRVQKRINAALTFDPARSQVQIWAVLRLASQQGKPRAIAWLAKQPQDSSTQRAQTLKLLNELDLMTFGTVAPSTISQDKKN